LFIKREDCSRLATGGNKTRKLEFLLGDAQRQGADTIVTSGATQSNHARQTAAAAAKMGFQCTVVLEARVPSMDPQYSASGNALLDKVLGASIVSVPSGADMPALVADVAQRLRDAGRSPYVIPVGGSNVIGTLGFVECAAEILAQTAELVPRITSSWPRAAQAPMRGSSWALMPWGVPVRCPVSAWAHRHPSRRKRLDIWPLPSAASSNCPRGHSCPGTGR
jgi:1-aminocyclopropane-1-carboxylate deaminase/D-cysteine desulfhydrase-like pyridoxal-dependent ACC family enzyme